MEDFINELRSNACSKSDYDKKNDEENMFFNNLLLNSIKQYSLKQLKKVII